MQLVANYAVRMRCRTAEITVLLFCCNSRTGHLAFLLLFGLPVGLDYQSF